MAKSIPDHWVQVLRGTDLFGGTDDVAFTAAVAAFEERAVPVGALLMTQGQDGDSLFVVLDGKLEVFLNGGVTLPSLGAGSVVGEIALVLGGKRSANVRAVAPVSVLELSRARFEALLDAHPTLASPLTRALQDRMRRARIAGHLQDIFGPLGAEALTDIERQLKWVHLASGQELVRQGDKADGAYIAALGRLRVAVRDRKGTERVIDETAPGQWVGEMALLTGNERSATVYAVRDSELVWSSQGVFDDLTRKYPQALAETARRIVARMQHQMRGERAPSTVSTFAVVPTSPGVAIDTFASDLCRALETYGTVLHLTSERVDERLGRPRIAQASDDDPGRLRLVPWLIEQESAHTFVVHQADKDWSGWTERAIRNADHVLFVADGASSAHLTDVERRFQAGVAQGRGPRHSLVLLQTDGRSSFPGTAAWLSARRVDAHYHVRKRRRTDVERLVRLLTDRSIAVVFGGGGSRGMGHIGILRVLDDLGVPIDAVGGASVGGVIAAARAMEMSTEEMLRIVPPLMRSAFFDPTLPIFSLMSGINLLKGVRSVVGDLQMEDLLLPAFAVSTSLTRGACVVHNTGSVAMALRATGSVPGVFPPVPWKGDLLVDGGLSANVPVDAMARLIGGRIIAVDLIPEVGLPAEGTAPEAISGWKFAWDRLKPGASKVGVPNIMNTLIRSATTSSQGLRTEDVKGRCDLYLTPELSRWNLLDFSNAQELADEADRSTRADLRSWWASLQREAGSRT